MFCTQSLVAHFISITSEQQLTDTIQNTTQPILLIFSAPWCSICTQIQKPLKELSEEASFKNIIFASIDITALKNIHQKFNVIGVPTFVYIKHGIIINQTIGVEHMDRFKKQLSNNLEALIAAPMYSKVPLQASKFSVLQSYVSTTINTIKTTLNTTFKKIKSFFIHV